MPKVLPSQQERKEAANMGYAIGKNTVTGFWLSFGGYFYSGGLGETREANSERPTLDQGAI